MCVYVVRAGAGTERGERGERGLWLIPICCGCIASGYWSGTEIPSDSSKLSVLLRRKMPQLARLSVEPGIPKIKRRLRTRKHPLETRLGFRGYTPRVGAFIERNDACCFPYFVGKVRYLGGHLRPPPQKGSVNREPLTTGGHECGFRKERRP